MINIVITIAVTASHSISFKQTAQTNIIAHNTADIFPAISNSLTLIIIFGIKVDIK